MVHRLEPDPADVLLVPRLDQERASGYLDAARRTRTVDAGRVAIYTGDAMTREAIMEYARIHGIPEVRWTE